VRAICPQCHSDLLRISWRKTAQERA
jgi:hypothetical protein